METNIDCMKYRTSTHLAGVDVEMMIAEKGKCELTIKLAYYDKGVNVSGNKTDGYFIEFEEVGIKPMMANSGNRSKISEIVKEYKGLTSVESRNVGNWVGTKIQLLFDPNVKNMGKVTGGIVVDKQFKLEPLANIEASKAALDKCTTLDQLKECFLALPNKANVQVSEYCSQLKSKLI